MSKTVGMYEAKTQLSRLVQELRDGRSTRSIRGAQKNAFLEPTAAELKSPPISTLLPFSLNHALAVAGLAAIHADPFDRMLIAQASIEGMTLVTRDAHIRHHNVRTLLARCVASQRFYNHKICALKLSQ